jgi:hypothetical protein
MANSIDGYLKQLISAESFSYDDLKPTERFGAEIVDQYVEDMPYYHEEEIKDKVASKTYYFNIQELYFGNNENKKKVLLSLMLEIDKLSWQLFHDNKTYGANCIDIFSPKVARVFNMFNIITNTVKFNNSINYLEKDSYLIGELLGQYKIFMPKETTRIVLGEKNNTKNKISEKFILCKWDSLEIYNSEMPENKLTIKLENIQ